MAKHLSEQQIRDGASTPNASSNGKAEAHRYRAWDKAVIVLAAMLLVALGAAALYGFKYANVETGAAVGKATIKKNEDTIIKMAVNEKMEARINYRERKMTGTLVLAGAETDTMLFQLKNIEYKDGSDASDAVLFVRMPRSGLKGDLSGIWMMYFSQPSADEKHSEWIITHEDGTADYGQKDNMNAITEQRFKLVEQSETDWTWESKKSVLTVKK